MPEQASQQTNIETLQQAFAQEQEYNNRAAAILLALDTLEPEQRHASLSYHDQVRRLLEVLTRELMPRPPDAVEPPTTEGTPDA